MPEGDLLVASEVMPIVKNLIKAQNVSELTKAVDELYAAYPEVVQEYLEDPQAPGHRFPGDEDKEGHVKKPFFGYKTGDKPAPQRDPEKAQPTIDPEPYLKRLAVLVKAFGPKRVTVKQLRLSPNAFLLLRQIRKAYAEELKASPGAPPAAAAPSQEKRLCPRCGGAPCYCPDGGGESGPATSAPKSPVAALGIKSEDGDTSEGSSEQKGPTAVTMDAKDFVEKPSQERPVTPAKT